MSPNISDIIIIYVKSIKENILLGDKINIPSSSPNLSTWKVWETPSPTCTFLAINSLFLIEPINLGARIVSLGYDYTIILSIHHRSSKFIYATIKTISNGILSTPID